MKDRQQANVQSWGVSWFLWNLPIFMGTTTALFFVIASVEAVTAGVAINPAGIFVDFIWGGVPLLSFFAWLAGSGLIAAFWATGLRNRILVRILVPVIPALLAIPVSENGWMYTYYVSTSLVLASVARLPRG